MGGKDRGGREGMDGFVLTPLSKELGWFIFVSESARRLDWARETTSQTLGGMKRLKECLIFSQCVLSLPRFLSREQRVEDLR